MKDFKYADSHEWVKVDGSSATVGITDHAQVIFFLLDLFLWSELTNYWGTRCSLFWLCTITECWEITLALLVHCKSAIVSSLHQYGVCMLSRFFLFFNFFSGNGFRLSFYGSLDHCLFHQIIEFSFSGPLGWCSICGITWSWSHCDKGKEFWCSWECQGNQWRLFSCFRGGCWSQQWAKQLSWSGESNYILWLWYSLRIQNNFYHCRLCPSIQAYSSSS